MDKNELLGQAYDLLQQLQRDFAANMDRQTENQIKELLDDINDVLYAEL
ncbi:MAG: hypothetical protein ABGY11_00040 [Candidatus Thioglobus sp.]|jgi:hypothetical protein